MPRGEGGPPSCKQVPPAEGYRNHRARPLRSFRQFSWLFAPNGAFSNLSHLLWLLLFCVRGGLVCPNFWLAFCAGIGPLTLVFVLFLRRFRLSKLLVSAWCWYRSFGAVIGRSVCAVVSFHLFLWSAPSVGTPSRNLAKSEKFES